MIYGYQCDHCGREFERVCSLADYEDDPLYVCQVCFGPTHQVLYGVWPLTHKPFEAFRSPVDGRVISTQRELAEHNKRNNVVNIHDGYDEKAVMGMTQKDYQAPLDGERQKDLKDDLEQAIAQCSDGYKPLVPREDDPP